MPESKKKFVTIHQITAFPVTIKYGTGTVTLVGEAELYDLGDLTACEGYYVEGDPTGDRSILFLLDGQEFEVVG